MAMNMPWAIEQLERFYDDAARHASMDPAFQHDGPLEESLDRQLVVVREIIRRVFPAWTPAPRSAYAERWAPYQDVALDAIEWLKRREELAQNLGDVAPRIPASQLHPWVWDGARSLWSSGHYREAVSAAARKLNAETQNKLRRRDLSETDLFVQAFTTDPPKPGAPRLRLATADGSKTYGNLHRGAMRYAEGCYAAIRAPTAHEADLPELTQSEALEQLAAFSVLARWVDGAAVDHAAQPPGPP